MLKIPYTHSTPTVHALRSNKELEERIAELKKSIEGEALVEEFIEGREFTVGIK